MILLTEYDVTFVHIMTNDLQLTNWHHMKAQSNFSPKIRGQRDKIALVTKKVI